jgi:hypothetical protein
MDARESVAPRAFRRVMHRQGLSRRGAAGRCYVEARR